MKSDFLFAQPSLLVGFARLIDLCGVIDDYNHSRSEAEADAKGLYSDFRITGEDILDAVQSVQDEDTAYRAEVQIPLFANR